MSALPGEEAELLPVAADLERRLILAQGLYPADRLFVPVPIKPEGRSEEE